MQSFLWELSFKYMCVINLVYKYFHAKSLKVCVRYIIIVCVGVIDSVLVVFLIVNSVHVWDKFNVYVYVYWFRRKNCKSTVLVISGLPVRPQLESHWRPVVSLSKQLYLLCEYWLVPGRILRVEMLLSQVTLNKYKPIPPNCNAHIKFFMWLYQFYIEFKLPCWCVRYDYIIGSSDITMFKHNISPAIICLFFLPLSGGAFCLHQLSILTLDIVLYR